MIAFRELNRAASSLEKKSAHPIRAPAITPRARQENGTIVPVDLPSSDCWDDHHFAIAYALLELADVQRDLGEKLDSLINAMKSNV